MVRKMEGEKGGMNEEREGTKEVGSTLKGNLHLRQLLTQSSQG